MPSKTTRPLASKNHQVYPNWQWNYKAASSCLCANIIVFFYRHNAKQQKQHAADGRGVTSFDICLEWLSHRLKKRNPLPPKNAFDPIFPSLSLSVPPWCAPLGSGETAVEGQEERGREETLWNVLEKRRGAVNPPNGCGRFFSSSLTRHLELSFVSRVWVYTTVLLGQPTCQTKYKKGNHTHIDWREQRGRKRDRASAGCPVEVFIEWRGTIKEE